MDDSRTQNPVTPESVASTLAAVGPAFEYLIRLEEYALVRQLALRLAERWPAGLPQTSDFLAMVLHRSKNYADAVAFARRTCELTGESLEARYNLARCLNSAGDPAQAEALMRSIAEARPDWVDPKLDLAVYVGSQGRQDEARRILEEAAKLLPPGHASQDLIRFNMGLHLMRERRFKEGFAALAVGRKYHIWGSHSVASKLSKPRLLPGMDVAGKTILLFGEGGLGDEIINVRFARVLRERGARVVWTGQKELFGLFGRAAGIDERVPLEALGSLRYDYWVPAMDAAHLLELELADIPREAYLSADPARARKWEAAIPDAGKLRVALRWQGNPLFELDLYRSVPFRSFQPLFANKEAEFFSFQRDSGLEELDASAPVRDLAPELRDWEDTAAALSRMDLVITTCTSIAHLAGALGKKTWVFVPMSCYYIWAWPEEHSPWYPDARLFRQSRYRSWDAEVQAMATELERMTGAPK